MSGVGLFVPPAERMRRCIDDAAEMLVQRVDPNIAPHDIAIPSWVFAKAKGLVFLWQYKVGFFASVSGGSGLLMAKFEDSNGHYRWSAPTAFQLGGGGGGFDFGAAVSQVILALDTQEAVDFFAGLSMNMSANVQVAVGEIGRHAEGTVRLDLHKGIMFNSAYNYNKSSGVFCGAGLQGVIILPRARENHDYYGTPSATPGEILSGNVGLAPPKAEVEYLHGILAKAEAGGEGWGMPPAAQLQLFVSGRVCLFGEHSDWAGAYRQHNHEIVPGATIVCGTEHEGLYATVRKRADHKLVLRSVLDNGEVKGPVEFPMEKNALMHEAQKGGFWGYACGVASKVVSMFDVAGLEIDNYKTTLPVKKGLSSSAALCVLVARAFSRAYGLGVSIRGEMELAYQGEILTPSQCGRMDQACAYGPCPVVLHYDGEAVEVEELLVGAPLHLVVADLNASKDTVIILEKLRECFPHPRNEVEEGVVRLLGEINKRVVESALRYIAEGKVEELGRLMVEAQGEFDKFGGAACPEQLTAPVLHKVLAHPALQPHIYGGKGVGSQGDGSVQFLCRGVEGQQAARRILEEDLKLHVLTLTIPASPPGKKFGLL